MKARGGVHELLTFVEQIGVAEGLVLSGGNMKALSTPEAHKRLSRYRVVVASTGNLGLSIGIAARAFGIAAQVHMSSDAKEWKRDHLRSIGVTVIEHLGDYGDAVTEARESSIGCQRTHFIDDERSVSLFVGYATAAQELANQILGRGIAISEECPLTVYLPCGVGGAPGGILFGLRLIYGQHVRGVFVEPTSSACMYVALACNGAKSRSIYDYDLDNVTVADGLAVAQASDLVLAVMADTIDAVVTLADAEILRWVAKAHRDAHMRLEPSASAALAAVAPYLAKVGPEGAKGIHVAWTTGGVLMPDNEFDALLASASPYADEFTSGMMVVGK